MTEKRMGFVPNAPLADVTYRVIGLAMATHSELGPGHREIAYHNAMAFRLAEARMQFEIEPYVPVTLPDGSIVRGTCPDFLINGELIVELKAHAYTMTRGEEAQVISYFAAFSCSSVALYLNFGHERLEFHRLFPPQAIQAFRASQAHGEG